MNNTEKREMRRFKEERSNVMKMNKLFAGLVALIAGLALSAGSASATKGYTIGDPAAMKLIPFYETGGSLFTAIAVQNMSPQEMATMTANTLVADLQDYLAGENPSAALVALSDDYVENTALVMTSLDSVAAVEAALEKAMMDAYTEHLFVVVRVHDAMGMMMMEDSLCLAENQQGYVVITGDGMAESIANRGLVLSMAADEIDAYGYVTVMAEGQKFTSCEGTPRMGLTGVVVSGEVDAEVYTDANGMIAAWTILQDVGSGFFGTEIPTSTITMATDDTSTTEVDESMPERLACYGTGAVFNARAGDAGGPYLCGLIPERHNNSRNTTADADEFGDLIDTASAASHVTARFDVVEGTENDVFVWLAAGGDTETTKPRETRELDVSVVCEDGTMAMIPGEFPGEMVSSAMIPAPGMVTMIDPAGDALGPYTSQCDGGRGVLRFAMPNNSHAGMVWTHISQRMSNFRMNMPGYNMADPAELDGAGLTAANM
jgi:hypothetical protein